MVSSLGESPVDSLPTMLVKNKDTTLFLVIKINAANNKEEQNTPEYHETLLNREEKNVFAANTFTSQASKCVLLQVLLR